MRAELVRTETSDGFRLDGAFLAPALERTEDLGVDAALLVHGTGANFYSSSLLRHLAMAFRDAGVAALVANTRGHDLIYTGATSAGPRLMGAAYETVSDCKHDLPAWLNYLRERGYLRLGLVGHSLGAIKSIFALTATPRDDVQRVVAVSPARLSHSHFLASEKADDFRAGLAEAQACLNRGAPDTLLQVKFPIPYLVTAAGYLDKYGPAEQYNVVNLLDRLQPPTLFTFGTRELASHPAFRGFPEAIEEQSRAKQLTHIATAVIADADHFYSGAQEAVWVRIRRWLREQA